MVKWSYWLDHVTYLTFFLTYMTHNSPSSAKL